MRNLVRVATSLVNSGMIARAKQERSAADFSENNRETFSPCDRQDHPKPPHPMSVRGTPPVAFHSPRPHSRPNPPYRHHVYPPCQFAALFRLLSVPLGNRPRESCQEGGKDATDVHRQGGMGSAVQKARSAHVAAVRSPDAGGDRQTLGLMSNLT